MKLSFILLFNVKNTNSIKFMFIMYAVKCTQHTTHEMSLIQPDVTSMSFPVLTINQSTLTKQFNMDNIIEIGSMHTIDNNIFFKEKNQRTKLFRSTYSEKLINPSTIQSRSLIIIASIDHTIFVLNNKWKKLSISVEYDEDHYAVLMVTTFNTQNLQNDNHITWASPMVNDITTYKKVNMKGDGKKHNQSYGNYYGLGMVGNYSKGQ